MKGLRSLKMSTCLFDYDGRIGRVNTSIYNIKQRSYATLILLFAVVSNKNPPPCIKMIILWRNPIKIHTHFLNVYPLNIWKLLSYTILMYDSNHDFVFLLIETQTAITLRSDLGTECPSCTFYVYALKSMLCRFMFQKVLVATFVVGFVSTGAVPIHAKADKKYFSLEDLMPASVNVSQRGFNGTWLSGLYDAFIPSYLHYVYHTG